MGDIKNSKHREDTIAFGLKYPAFREEMKMKRFGKSHQLKQEAEMQQNMIQTLEEEYTQLKKKCESLENRVDHLYDLLKTYEDVLVNIRNNNAQIADLQQFSETASFKIKKLEKRISAPVKEDREYVQTTSAEVGNPAAAAKTDAYTSIDYFDFENHFRGDRTLIKTRQTQYLPYFKGCRNVIDIGCGRGEFLQLLKENSIEAVGVDTYDEFVEYCRDLDLKAVCDDGNHYLQSIDHADGIFVGQVVEHMTTEQIIELCNIAWEKLKAGAYLIIETPNPTSLAIYTHAFYMDPSHMKPVHPLTMEYFLRNAGFKDINIVYTPCSRLETEIPRLDGENIKNLDAFNDAMHVVSETLFGSQDYAIIARKPEDRG